MNRKWSERFNQLPAERREKIEAEVATLLHELPLHELRRARQLSQEQLAKALGEKQSSISKLEQRTDMYVSTLRRYVAAMGGELVIAARFPAGAVEITEFGKLAAREAAKRQPTRPGKSTPVRNAVPARVAASTRSLRESSASYGKGYMSGSTKSTKNSGKVWDSAAVKQLEQLATGNTPTRVIGLKLGRTPGAVQAKASEKGISLKPANQSPYNRRKK